MSQVLSPQDAANAAARPLPPVLPAKEPLAWRTDETEAPCRLPRLHGREALRVKPLLARARHVQHSGGRQHHERRSGRRLELLSHALRVKRQKAAGHEGEADLHQRRGSASFSLVIARRGVTGCEDVEQQEKRETEDH